MKIDSKGKVLVVDDEPNAIRVLSSILSEEGYDVSESIDVDKAIDVIQNDEIDAIITDLKMPGKDGMQLFEYTKQTYPDIPVIFLTAFGTVESAVYAMTHDAFYYFIKPPDYQQLKAILARAVEQRLLKRELASLRKRLLDENNRYRIIGNTPEIRRILETIEAIKDSTSSVIIYGETGTGKELVARALHYNCMIKKEPFIPVNCAAVPKELMESELFGYEKGAFTGAFSKRIGKFEEAADGIIFLDEIGELELSVQAKLLRVLQEREIERIGSNRKIKVNFRLISSTNRDLKKEVQNGNFREDLFYRINVLEIKVPSLWERKDDIPLLVSEFLKEFCVREKKVLTVSDEVTRAFYDYSWPGNVRQLRNIIERAVVLAKGSDITIEDLPNDFKPVERVSDVNSIQTLKEMGMKAIKDALHECNGNKSKAAKTLGMSRKSFYKRLEEIQL